MDEALDRGGHRPVHHLQAGRDDAGGDDRRDRVAGLADVVEARQDAARRLRLRQQLHRDLDDHREHAFAADHQRQQVEPGRIERVAAELDRLALGGEAAHLAARCAASGRTSGSARRPSSRRRCRRWCRRSGCSGRARRTGRSGAAASLIARLRTPHCTVAVRATRSMATMRLNLARLSVTPSAVRQRAAREPGAGAARHHRHLEAVADRQHRGDLRLALGQGDDQRLLAIGGEAVAFVRHRVLALPEQGMRRQRGAERGDDLGLAARALAPRPARRRRGRRLQARRRSSARTAVEAR